MAVIKNKSINSPFAPAALASLGMTKLGPAGGPFKLPPGHDVEGHCVSAFPANALVREHLGEACLGLAAAVSAAYTTLFMVAVLGDGGVEVRPVAAYRDDTVLAWRLMTVEPVHRSSSPSTRRTRSS